MYVPSAFSPTIPWRGNCEKLSNMNSNFANVTADYANQFIEQTPTVLYKQLNKSQILTILSRKYSRKYSAQSFKTTPINTLNILKGQNLTNFIIS